MRTLWGGVGCGGCCGEGVCRHHNQVLGRLAADSLPSTLTIFLRVLGEISVSEGLKVVGNDRLLVGGY